MKEEQILNAARRLFSKYGYKKVSMDEIAKEAKVTKKTVYSYFESKEELLKRIIKQEEERMKQIVESIEKKNIPFFKKIHKGICEMLKYKRDRKFLKIIFKESETLRNQKLNKDLKVIDETIKSYIKEKLIDANENGFIKISKDDIDITTFLVYKMYISLISEWEDDYIEDERLADNIINILENGLKGRNEIK